MMFSFPDHPAITAVIPTFGMKGAMLTETCIRTMLRFHGHLASSLEIIVVEDSQDEDVLGYLKAMLKRYSESIMLLSQANGGFAKACNAGMRQSSGAVVFLVNNDIEFIEPALQIMADAVISTRTGAIGCRLLYPNGTIQHGGVVFVPDQTPNAKLPGYFDHMWRNAHALHPGAVTMRPSLITGALFGIPRTTIEVVGYLDENYGFTAEDIDYCLRIIETGMDCIYFGYVSAIHHEGATRGRTLEEKQRLAPDVAERESKSLTHLFEKWAGTNWSNFMR
jgi:GT2 family glycosyltransferase